MAKNSNVIYSTLTAPQEYALWKSNKDITTKVRSVIINGGANVADKFLVTPKGAVTIVNDEQLEVLQSNPSFKRHKDRGFILVEAGKAQSDVEKAISDMTGRDESSPLVPEDYAEGKAPVTSDAPAPPPPPSRGR
jgi:hypothetical protein